MNKTFLIIFFKYQCCGVYDHWVCSGLPDRVPTHACNCTGVSPEYQDGCKPVQDIRQCNFNEFFPGDTKIWAKVRKDN